MKRREKRYCCNGRGRKINSSDISRSGCSRWSEPSNDSRFVKRRCIIQADIKGLTQPSAMMGGEVCVCVCVCLSVIECVCGRRWLVISCLAKTLLAIFAKWKQFSNDIWSTVVKCVLLEACCGKKNSMETSDYPCSCPLFSSPYIISFLMFIRDSWTLLPFEFELHDGGSHCKYISEKMLLTPTCAKSEIPDTAANSVQPEGHYKS